MRRNIKRSDRLGALFVVAVLVVFCAFLPATQAVQPEAAAPGSRWANVEHTIKDAAYSAINPMLWDVADPGEPTAPEAGAQEHAFGSDSLLHKAKESIAAAKEAAAELKPQEHHGGKEVAHNALSVFRAAEEQLRKWALSVTKHMVRGCYMKAHDLHSFI